MKYLELPLLVLDVLVNIALCIVGSIFALDASMLAGCWRTTLSARAGFEASRGQRYFGWTASAIDLIFGSGHCATQYATETKFGGIWAAWAAE